MTPKQLFTRLKAYLKTVVWEGTANKIFGEFVYVVPEVPILQACQFVPPCAFIIDQGAIPDKEHPGLLTQNFTIAILVENIQSEYGEGLILSACRIADTSKGAGLLDIEEDLLLQLIEKIELTTKLMLIEKGVPKSGLLKSNNQAVIRSLTFSALVGIY